MLKVIVDVNIWVSALLNSGNAREIQDAFEGGQFQLVVSPQILAECAEVLARPRFSERIQPERRNRLIALMRKEAQALDFIAPLSEPISRDPKDDYLLLCAVAGQCDFIVSGDNDLLCLGQYQSVRIVTPTEFLVILKS